MALRREIDSLCSYCSSDDGKCKIVMPIITRPTCLGMQQMLNSFSDMEMLGAMQVHQQDILLLSCLHTFLGHVYKTFDCLTKFILQH